MRRTLRPFDSCSLLNRFCLPIRGQLLDPLQHGPGRSILRRDAKAVREMASRLMPVGAPVGAQGKLIVRPQLLLLNRNPACRPDDLELR